MFTDDTLGRSDEHHREERGLRARAYTALTVVTEVGGQAPHRHTIATCTTPESSGSTQSSVFMECNSKCTADVLVCMQAEVYHSHQV